MKWLLLYIALIPAFAAWYVSMPPHSLRDSNIESERSLEDDAFRLLPSLTTMVNRRGIVVSWTYLGNELHVIPKTLSADGLGHTTDGRLLILIEGKYVASSRDKREWTGGFRQWIELSDHGREIPVEGGRRVYFCYEVVQVTGLGLRYASDAFSPPVSALLPPAREPHPMPQPGIGLLPLTPVINEKLTRFYEAADGDPSYASGKWVRALYLSGTTLTTLGLGDMTAISDEGRIAMGIEAPAGILVLALFANGLTRRRRRALKATKA